MKLRARYLIVCVVFITIIAVAGCSWLFGGGTTQAIVVFSESQPLGAMLAALSTVEGFSLLTKLPIINGLSCELTSGAMDALEKMDAVRYVEKAVEVYALDMDRPQGMVLSAAEIPDESVVNFNMKMINADAVWYINQGVGVRVGVLDTGIDSHHVDFMEGSVSAVVPGFNAINGGSTEDDQGHGTSVASIIGARRNGVGIIGVARGCSLVPIKVLGSSGSGTSVDVCEGYQWALDHGVQVMNVSLGSYIPSTAMQEAMESARKQGMGTCCATGNDGRNAIIYPARNSYAICVGASDMAGNKVAWSNYGPEMVENGVIAPGDWVLVAQNGGGWRRVSGTSIATPHVTGQLADLVGMGFGWREFIFRSASTPDAPSQTIGHGMIDVLGSVRLLEAYEPE